MDHVMAILDIVKRIGIIDAPTLSKPAHPAWTSQAPLHHVEPPFPCDSRRRIIKRHIGYRHRCHTQVGSISDCVEIRENCGQYLRATQRVGKSSFSQTSQENGTPSSSSPHCEHPSRLPADNPRTTTLIDCFRLVQELHQGKKL
jgi:hypothetical protein